MSAVKQSSTTGAIVAGARTAVEIMPTAKDPRARSWWQHMSVDEFRTRLGQINSRTELQTLIAEAKSALHAIQLELETRGRGDCEWHRRAKYALRNVAERRRFMVVRLAEIPDPFRGERFNSMAKAKELLDARKTEESLRIVIDVLSDFFENGSGRKNGCHDEP